MAAAGPTGIEYRRGTPEDCLCVSVLAMQVFLDTYATDGIRRDLACEVLSNYMPEKFAERLVHRSVCFLLAERTGHLVAFAEVVLHGEPPVPSISRGAELVRLYFHSQFKRRGVGRTLLAQAEAIAKSKSAECLWLTAWAGNRQALAFYAALGYTDIGATTYVFQGNSYENRIFTRTLASAP